MNNYTPLNNRLIVKRLNEKTTTSGIVIAETDGGAVLELVVVATPTEHSRFKDKTIVVERRHVIEFSEGAKVGAVKVDDVLAVVN